MFRSSIPIVSVLLHKTSHPLRTALSARRPPFKASEESSFCIAASSLSCVKYCNDLQIRTKRRTHHFAILEQQPRPFSHEHISTYLSFGTGRSFLIIMRFLFFY